MSKKVFPGKMVGVWEGGTGKKDEQEVIAGSLPPGSLDIVKVPLQRVLVGVRCFSPSALL